MLAFAAGADAQSIGSSVIASGGGVSRAGCRVLEGTIGEVVVGRASGGVFAISAGYLAGAGSAARDAIFHDGFQECGA